MISTSCTAFLSPSPLAKSKVLFQTRPPPLIYNHVSETPTCALSKHLATAAVAALALTTSVFPSRSLLLPAAAAEASQSITAIFQPCQTMVQTVSHNISNPVAVVGVGKAAIHDYSVATQASIDAAPYMASRSVPYSQRLPNSYDTSRDRQILDNDLAKREFALAVRLVTAVLLGVMLGIERRATSLNLGVRSITVISLSAAMVSVMAMSAEFTGLPVILAVSPLMAVVSAAGLTGLVVYVAAKSRRRSTKHVASMSGVVALGVAMGGACGAGLSVLTIFSYLFAVGIMRGEHNSTTSRRRKYVQRQPLPRDDESVPRRTSLDPLIKAAGRDGTGLST